LFFNSLLNVRVPRRHLVMCADIMTKIKVVQSSYLSLFIYVFTILLQ